MASRKSDSFEDLVKLVFLLVIMGGLVLWGKTHSAPTTIIWMCAVILSLTGFAFAYAKHRQGRLLGNGIDVVDTMSGEEFESFLKAHFENLGYRVELTPTRGDYGADLIATRETVKYVVQAKRWKRPVGIEAVQQVVGAIKHYNASHAIVITNSHFTGAARDLARSNEVELWDRIVLTRIMAEANGKEWADQIHAETVNRCPRCGGILVKRNGKRGEFLGCSSFPKCRYTRDLS